MAKSIISKVMWVGRATVFVVGLAVVLALMLGVATAALGAPASTFKLGQINTSNLVSTLLGSVAGPNLKIQNTSTDTNATALDLQVSSGKAPLRVNAGAGTATNLDADKVDGREANSFANASHEHAGEDITSGTVEADRIENGPGSNLDADTVDGLDSTDLGAASNLEVGRLELAKPIYNPPQISPPDNTGTVLETDAFLIRGVCRQYTIPTPTGTVSLAEGLLLLVAKQPTSAVTYTSEESTTPSEVFDLQPGQSIALAGTPRNLPGYSPDSSNTYGSYLADAPGGFLEGQGSVSINNGPTGPGDTCRFSATGLGK